jgi:phosphoribosylaminoimidazole-succinocarboxamide synthase
MLEIARIAKILLLKLVFQTLFILSFILKLACQKLYLSPNKSKMSAVKTVSETNAIGLLLVHRGKVRDVYRTDERELLLVATDRISAFDCVFPTPIPHKGAVLTALSAFWFEKLKGLTKNHLITSDFDKMPEQIRQIEEFRGRSTLVKKTEVFPVECIVRGYLEGSGWKDYQSTGEICGHRLPSNLKQCEKLSQPIFTPATKARNGHDENITEAEFAKILSAEDAAKLKSISLKIYREACEYALTRGVIIADTKFEFGMDENGDILLVDEILTPDSSRFWSLENYMPGKSQVSFDKQFVREYLETLDWNKKPPAPSLPEAIVKATTARYLEAFRILTGKELA